MKIKLKDGKAATVKFLSESDDVHEFRLFINALIDENVHILMDRCVTLKEQIQWKNDELYLQKRKKSFMLVVRIDGKLAATSGAKRERHSCRDNILVGIVIRKEFRGLGLGEALLKENIRLCKSKLKARIIYLNVFANNRKAYSLYRKLGFKEVARLPKWIPYKGRYTDLIFMKL